MNKHDLIWVSKEFKEKFEAIDKEEEKLKVLDEYLESVKKDVRDEFKNNLDNLEEDVALFSGLMIKVKREFEKAKGEQLSASYALWETFEEEIPSVKKKTEQIISSLEPLTKELEKINNLLTKIDTYNMDKLFTSIGNLTSLYGQSEEMFKFLVRNFSKQ